MKTKNTFGISFFIKKYKLKNDQAPGTQKKYFTTQKFVHEFLRVNKKTSDVYLEKLNYKFIKDFEKFQMNYHRGYTFCQLRQCMRFVISG